MYIMYMPEVWFDSVAEGRSHLRELLDAAAQGFPAGMRRDNAGFAIVDAARLRRLLAVRSGHAEIVAEADGWSIFVPGIPVAADGETLPEATAEMIDALREYAADWIDRLHVAPNHTDNWWLVQLVELSSDAELADWLTAGQLAPQP
jgi:predicted RNase H-like HicB family nuclease